MAQLKVKHRADAILGVKKPLWEKVVPGSTGRHYPFIASVSSIHSFTYFIHSCNITVHILCATSEQPLHSRSSKQVGETGK